MKPPDATQFADRLRASASLSKRAFLTGAGSGLGGVALSHLLAAGSADRAVANPLAPNPDGHIIRWKDSRKHTGLSFEWDIFLIAESTHGTEDTFSDPDGLYADPDGRLFIQTDGGQKDGLNNQLLVADTRTGELRRLFTGVTSDEITGVTMTPDRRTLFINTQHPGNGNPALTNFPAPIDGVTVPRDCTFVITRKDGGIIGS